MRRLSILFLFVSAAFGQRLSVGVLGGAPVTNLVTGESGPRYTVGPTVQLLLPLGFAVEADALYRGFDFRAPNPASFLLGSSLQTSAFQWRFPILLQYRFPTPLLKPFVEAGVSFDRISGIKQAVTSVRNSGDLLQTTHAGAVVGAGLEVKLPFVRITPGFRYTRQGSSDFRDISNLDQFEFLVGIRF